MEETTSNFRRNVMLIGAIGGAVVGLLAARVFIRSAEEEAAESGKDLAITPAKGLQIGVLVMGLLRQLSNL
ncbi:MAG: hypothetical protein JW757_04455 [Anaerolineales bacterium]|nr:hypothetical protein [Anaerolineales bacterium]